jgi:hypothetical protein
MRGKGTAKRLRQTILRVFPLIFSHGAAIHISKIMLEKPSGKNTCADDLSVIRGKVGIKRKKKEPTRKSV